MKLFSIRNIGFFVTMVLIPWTQLCAQQVIKLNNPSFEDWPQHSHPPEGWSDCGFFDESPPDVQPSGAWGVFWPAMDGKTYLGMVARHNDTYESVGQRLNDILWAGTCYQISFFLCKSPVYFSSVNDISGDEEKRSPVQNFVTPIKLRIWAGNDMCHKQELIGETGLVTNNEWERYHIKLSPKRGNYKYIFLEAYYETPTLFAYNGNILVDDASDIVALAHCDDKLKEEDPVEAPVVQIIDPVEKIDTKEMLYRLHAKIENVDSKERVFIAVNDYEIKDFTFNPQTGAFSTYLKLAPGRNAIKVIGSNRAGTDTDSTFIRTIDPLAAVNKVPEPINKPVSKPKTTINASKYKLTNKDGESSLKKGDIVNLEHLQFKADRSDLSRKDSMILDELFQFMQEYREVEIEIGGHTNSLPDGRECQKISQERAMAVATYLVERGIDFKRLTAMGYGKKYPIATNETPEGRKRNQRVEIKILKIGQ
ncbi:OmpA family protein [Membranicola marinus]|uniref:OmpA family protein n=1 Tax=Membranihabitans marinus TaxID=1227546 RepID=A0A953HYX8_9BACT|nr:OmpA family protein [Membranihabitans marinus]MBY5958262.1 OmpA family protein [Membranihabitans marinus]